MGKPGTAKYSQPIPKAGIGGSPRFAAHTAIEAKEGVASKAQGMILGQITLQHLSGMYPRKCGMTGTASTQIGRAHV